MKKTTPTSWTEEAKDLGNRYTAVLGGALIFVLFGLIVVPSIVRERRPPGRVPSNQPALPSIGWLNEAEAPPTKGRFFPPVDPATVMTSRPALLDQGKVLFVKNCVSCHGEGGNGDGPAASTLNPKPRAFGQQSGWKRGYRVTDIYGTLTTGIKNSAMAPFDFLRPTDRMALVHYVRAFGKFDHGPEDEKASKALADSFRSAGYQEPNRIPVSLAMEKLRYEAFVPEIPRFAFDDPTYPQADLFRSLILNRSTVERTVAQSLQLQKDTNLERAWVAGAPFNGFAPALATLDEETWRQFKVAILGTPPNEPASLEGDTP
jgi:mono/diheme cytochrome c family protein